MRSYWGYSLASNARGTLYIGITNGIIRRVEQYRAGKACELHPQVQGASARLVPGI